VSEPPARGDDHAIEVRNVSKRFRLRRDRPSSLKEFFVRPGRSPAQDFWALRDVSLTIPKGSTYGLIGHNGSGKSTLLRTVAGIHRPTQGAVTVSGRVSALLELGAGFHPELTGRENVYLNGSILGLTRREIRSRIGEIAEFAGLGDFLDAPVRFYSSGMYVRLGFAVAVHVDPEILIVDEVIAVGDEEFQRRCFDHLYELRRKGLTLILVSHSHALVEQICDEVAWLDHGHLIGTGSPGEMTRRYVEQVNEAETSRLQAESTIDEALVHPPRGSGEIAVKSVEYWQADRIVQAATTGEPLRMRMRFVAKEPIDHPIFGVGLHHENGTHIAGVNTHIAGVDTGLLEGRGHVDVCIDRLPLMPGRYRVTTAVYDKHLLHAFDVRDLAFPLHVQPGRVGGQLGLVDLGVEWDVSADDRSSAEAS
jgi:ABC-2 type transport system ATP-binding protein/lipopolysaccharide transport system ATP-binding protein